MLYYAAPLGLPAAWSLVTLGSAVLAVGLLLCAVFWRIRLGQPMQTLDSTLLRLRGRISGPGPRGRAALLMEPSNGLWKLPPLEVSTRGGQRWPVSVCASTMLRWPRRGRYRGRGLRWLAVDDAVTLEGYVTLAASREATYRTPAGERQLEAILITRGTWPEVRGLGLAVLLCAGLAVAGGLVHALGERYQVRPAHPASLRVSAKVPPVPAGPPRGDGTGPRPLLWQARGQ